METMKKEIKEELELIATRVPPGDRWSLVGDKTKIYGSITDTLEAYFQLTRRACEYRLAPLKGELYAVHSQEVEIAPDPPKRYDIYGDYE
jgi:8-oxo-dGTP pyrophosphatase MutT (NUDIX family)